MSVRQEGFGDNVRNAFGRSFFLGTLVALPVVLSSCASVPRLQPEINNLVVAGQWNSAVDKIEAKQADYGHGNYLLYYLDRGMVEQAAGRYSDSIQSFEKAKQRFRELYTQSLSKEAASWVWNDYALPYHGSDYEYVLINVFQALNFVQTGRTTEALVEARDLDSKFRVIEEIARNSKRQHFGDNGFARLLMGILYEASGTSQDVNDAWIAYRQALALYDGYYGGTYVPVILQQRLVALARKFRDSDLGNFERRFPAAARDGALREEGKAVVYLIDLVGHSPVKVEEMLPVPIDREFITKIAVPRFVRRPCTACLSRLVAEPGSGGASVVVDSELGDDIEDVAIRDLESRRALILSKAILRPGLKYLIERKEQENIRKKNGEGAAEVFTVLSDLYNLFSEKADLRSWQTLPGQVRIARLVLDPGRYRFHVHGSAQGGVLVGIEDVGEGDVKAGEVRFLVHRSGR